MTYTRDLVEHLLPSVWDPTCAYGMSNPYEPAADMPRSAPDKGGSSTPWAHMADVKSSWQQAPLTFKQRQAVLLRYGLGYTDSMAGALVGISGQAMGQRADAGVSHLTAWLNGTAIDDLDDEDVMV